jgi:phasin family protein
MPSFPTNPLMQSGLEAQVGFITEVTRRSYDAMRKLNELNLQFVQQAMQDAAEASRSMLACTDPFQLAAAAAKASQPATEHLRHYQQQLFNMFSGAQFELARQTQTLMPQNTSLAGTIAHSLARDSNSAAESRSYSGNGAHHTPG